MDDIIWIFDSLLSKKRGPSQNFGCFSSISNTNQKVQPLKGSLHWQLCRAIFLSTLSLQSFVPLLLRCRLTVNNNMKENVLLEHADKSFMACMTTDEGVGGHSNTTFAQICPLLTLLPPCSLIE